jgi:hypothetical protein
VTANVPLVTLDYENVTGVGFGGSIFAGYDWWLGPQWSLGLAVLATTTTQAPMQASGAQDSGYSLALSTIGFGGSLLYQ